MRLQLIAFAASAALLGFAAPGAALAASGTAVQPALTSGHAAIQTVDYYWHHRHWHHRRWRHRHWEYY